MIFDLPRRRKAQNLELLVLHGALSNPNLSEACKSLLQTAVDTYWEKSGLETRYGWIKSGVHDMDGEDYICFTVNGHDLYFYPCGAAIPKATKWKMRLMTRTAAELPKAVQAEMDNPLNYISTSTDFSQMSRAALAEMVQAIVRQRNAEFEEAIHKEKTGGDSDA